MLKHPPPSDYCRLCVRNCSDDQRSLYDESGQANANHDLVGKYFTNTMLNMEWERRLQYICCKCWQHIWEFHKFQESIIEAQKGLQLQVEATKEVEEVKIKSELNINQQEAQLELHITPTLSASMEDLIKPTALTFDIKTEEPLDLNSDYEGISSHNEQDHLTDEKMSLMMSNSKEYSSLRNDDESNEDFSLSDDMPFLSLDQTNYCYSDKKVPTTKKSVDKFDEMVASWRSSLECEICHQRVASYSQLKEHFSKNHASEGCYLMCCQLRLETRSHIDRHIRYHNAPQQLKCEACCKAYRHVRYLRIHKRNFHTSKGGNKNAKDIEKSEGKYHCCKCSKDFATEKHLNQHNRYIHKLKNLECNLCDKTFLRPDILREHLARHKGDKTHACSVCPKAFTLRSSFCRHMSKFHPREWQTIQSEAAQKEKAQKESLKEYRLEARGNSMVYVCIYCSVEYDKPSSMNIHIRQCRRDGGTKEQRKMEFRLETRGESIVYICIYCSKEDEASLAKQAPIISEPIVPAVQQQRTRVSQETLNTRTIGPKTIDVTNTTPDGNTLNELGKKGEEDSLMTPIEGKVWKNDENTTKPYVKTEHVSAGINALGNEQMDEHETQQELKDSTWESDEFIKSEEEFIEL
uniref:C2H2-type domain-containing protein n=1 Tax=Stomoxys calcitrans TaxID=35570 RepID=A0A1I8Q413_STOCA